MLKTSRTMVWFLSARTSRHLQLGLVLLSIRRYRRCQARPKEVSKQLAKCCFALCNFLTRRAVCAGF